MTSEPPAQPADLPLLRLRGVAKSFGETPVLHDVSFDVARGEVVVVLGPSGSGKSTLLRLINRLETPDAGDILLDGQPQADRGPALAGLRARVGMVFQQFNLFQNRTVLENVMLGPVRVRGMAPADAEARARALLERVGVAAQADRLPRQLSGGQQQRVAIARTLAMDPELILFDEPTSALDPEMVGEVLAVMESLARDGMTMIVVTHEIGFARRVASRVLFLDGARVLEDSAAGDFFAAPRTERARDFLAQVLPG